MIFSPLFYFLWVNFAIHDPDLDGESGSASMGPIESPWIQIRNTGFNTVPGTPVVHCLYLKYGTVLTGTYWQYVSVTYGKLFLSFLIEPSQSKFFLENHLLRY
jgi:hypothetical protein